MRKNSAAICTLLIISLAGQAGQVFSRPPKKTFSPRWPEHTVLSPPDTSGDTWHQTGVLQTAYRTARGDIKKRFRHQGCVLEKNMILSAKPGHRRELTLWRWGKKTFLVMLSESTADQTALAWGMISSDSRRKSIKETIQTP